MDPRADLQEVGGGGGGGYEIRVCSLNILPCRWSKHITLCTAAGLGIATDDSADDPPALVAAATVPTVCPGPGLPLIIKKGGGETST